MVQCKDIKGPSQLSSKLTISVPLESLGAFLKSKQCETNMSSSSQQSTTDVATKSVSNVKHLTMHCRKDVSYKDLLFD